MTCKLSMKLIYNDEQLEKSAPCIHHINKMIVHMRSIVTRC